MPVSSTHPKYNCYAKRWALVRAIVQNDAQHLIRTVDKNDPNRSKQYKEDAVLTNFTRLTRDGLSGLVSRRPANITLPSDIEYLLDDATGENVGLEQLAYHVLCEILETGRIGLLAEYPQVTPDLSSVDKEANGYYARIKCYCAESIIDHHYRQIGSKYMLSQVRIKEMPYELAEDGFEQVQNTYYRVLYLDFAGRYAQARYNEKEELIEGPFYPLDKDGKEWKEIPFQFLGAKCNDGEFDEIPLYDLALLNLGHYRNSADLEESSFICGQPHLHVDIGTNTSAEEFQAANPNGVNYGSRAGTTTSGGHLELVQANPNQLADQLMKRKEEQAAAIGARLIAPAGGRETAEAARIRYGAQNSALYVITYNEGNAFEQVLKWVCAYQGGDPETIEFELNDQFYDDSADPNLLVQQMQLYDRKLMSGQEIIKYGQKTGFISDNRDPEELLAEAEKNIVPAVQGTPNMDKPVQGDTPKS